jgi:hypothetical protein
MPKSGGLFQCVLRVEAREPRHMPQLLQRGTTPQGAGADEEEFEG